MALQLTAEPENYRGQGGIWFKRYLLFPRLANRLPVNVLPLGLTHRHELNPGQAVHPGPMYRLAKSLSHLRRVSFTTLPGAQCPVGMDARPRAPS